MLRMVIIIWILSVSGSLYASTEKNLSLYLSAGSAVSVGDLSEQAPYGYQGKVGFGFKPSPQNSPELEVITCLQYSFFPAQEDIYGDILFLLAGLDFKLRLHPPDEKGLYVTVGGGYAYTRIDERTFPVYLGTSLISERTVPERTENNTYFAPGIGYEFGKAWGIEFYFEGRLLNVFGTYIKNNIMLPLSFGVRF
jgi:hypothetical protein